MKRTRKFPLGNENKHDNARRYEEFSLKQIDSEVEKESLFNGKAFITQVLLLRVQYGVFPFMDVFRLENEKIWKTLEKMSIAPFTYLSCF